MTTATLEKTPGVVSATPMIEKPLLVIQGREDHYATPEQLADLDLVKKLIKNQTQRLSRYTCKSCGFKARQFYWRCPACSEWESYPPKRTEEFSLAQ